MTFFDPRKSPLCSGRSSDSWIILLTAPSRDIQQWLKAAFIPNYSGGPVPESHGVPCYALSFAPEHELLVNIERINLIVKIELYSS